MSSKLPDIVNNLSEIYDKECIGCIDRKKNQIWMSNFLIIAKSVEKKSSLNK